MRQIPFINTPDKPLKSSSQDIIPIADIVDDIVLLKDGGACLVLESTSLNFGLLSEKEQEAVIVSYAALISSLSFSIQIVIRSQKKDITKYINYLKRAQDQMTDDKLRNLMIGYRNFIIEITQKKNVLGKRFFMVLPFLSTELGIAKGVSSIGHKGPLPYTKDFALKKAKTALYPKKEHLIRQASRLGLQLHALEREDLVALYYDIYNPDAMTVKIDPSHAEQNSADLT